MHLDAIDFLGPLDFPFWKPPFLGGLRAHSVISHVHSELLISLDSVQVVWFSIICTVLRYPCLTLGPVLNNTSQTRIHVKAVRDERGV